MKSENSSSSTHESLGAEEDNIGAKLAKHNNAIDQLQAKIAESERELRELRAENGRLRSKVVQLEIQVSKMKRELSNVDEYTEINREGVMNAHDKIHNLIE